MTCSIDLLLTETWTTGGMQEYNRRLLQALRACTPTARLRAKTLNDRDTREGVIGFAGSRSGFARAVLSGLRSAPGSVIVGQVQLVPLALLYRLRSRRTRIYLIAHGVEVDRRLDPLTWLALHMCHSVLCVSESTRAIVVKRQRVTRAKTEILHVGISPAAEPKLEPAPARSTTSGPSLLTVTRLVQDDAYKGVDVTIRACARLRTRWPDLSLTIVGDGDDRPRLQRLTEALELTEHVHFLGGVTDSDLWQRYSECDMFVLPSTREGLGIVYLEAMSHGKPVIAVDAGGVSDVVVHEANGLLLSSQDEEELAGAIARLAESRELQVRLGEFGARTTVPAFSVTAMRDTVCRILDRGTGCVTAA